MANGVPYLISNGLTVLAIFIDARLNPLLTLFIIVMLVIMFFIVK